MDKIVNIQNLDPTTLELQTYSTDDQNLISSFDLENSFTSSVDYIEYSVYDINQDLLLYISNFTNYSLLNNTLQIDPEKDLNAYGFDEGQYITNYNFLKNILGSTQDNRYYISEISSDRTEIRLDTTLIPNDIVINQTNDYKIQLEQSSYYKDFYLNFGNNDLVIANNVLLDNSDPNNPTVLIKLYDPLPSQFDLKSELWVVETISEPLTYQIDITLIFDNLDSNVYLQGPNFNIPIKDRINNSTEFTNYNTLKSTTSAYGTSSLQYQLNSVLDEKGFEINIDYTDYSNFIFFSSAQTRLENFYYKISLIEEYSRLSSQNVTGSATGSYYVSSSFDIYQAKIDDIITKFDGYEYYLYFESGSKSWPKTNTDIPYVNASTGSALVQSWLTTQYVSASYYDNDLNPNNLVNTIPGYLREDSNNDQYILFVEMIGQHFDSIWVYIKDITNKYNADNRLDYGVSKDLISDVLRDLGVKIYQNNFSVDDLYTSFLGITPGGSLLPPTGSELITSYITASLGPYVLPGYVITGYVNGQPIIVPLADVNASIYKRIYHNVPYLFKKKGTVEGLRALITLYGIPDTILRINEFGGKNKDNSNDWDQWQDQFDYAFYTEGTNYISSSYVLNSTWGAPNNNPSAIAFRLKPETTPITNASQSIWSTNKNALLTLTYTGSGQEYSGSFPNPYYQYGTLTLYPSSSNLNQTASVYLPFFNGDWWSILINSGSNGYELIAKNKIYSGNDGNQIGFQASSSILSTASWSGSTINYFGTGSFGTSYKIFSGSLQEIRYYTLPLSQSVFDDYVMNPYSIESSEYLAFRAPLGGELYINSSSIHPKVTGSWIATSSFSSSNDFHFNFTSSLFIANTETLFLDQFPAGIRNAINNKIKIGQTILPSGNTLSPYIRIQQNLPVSGSYTKDINLLEVAFSPQNEINQDIISQLGYFNLGDYIGDPRQLVSTADSYPDLNTLRNNYFEKYTHNYNLTDYVRLIKYFDNSLFKMIKDFVPARTSLSSGVVIKQHLLERNRYRVPSSSYSEPYYTGSVKSFPFDFKSSQLYRTSGGDAGSLPTVNFGFNYFNQSLLLDYLSPNDIFTLNVNNPGVLNIKTTHDGFDDVILYDGIDANGTQIFVFGSPTPATSSFYNFNITSSTGYLTFYNIANYGIASALNNLLISSTSSINQSWPESIVTPLGIVNRIHSDQSEFLTGELSGSEIIVTTQSLLPQNNSFVLDLIETINAVSIFQGSYYDIPFEFSPYKVYYIQFGFGNADLTSPVTVSAFWLGTNIGDPNNVVYQNTISPSTTITPFIKIENAKTSTLRIINLSPPFFPNLAASALIYETPLDLFNPILNNAIEARPSTYFMDVDYSSGQFIPVNQGAIITGSATKATTQDYNWNVRRSILPRYSGSRLTGAQINKYTPGDVSYGKEPVINNTQTYFLTFKENRGAYPELVGKSTLWINSLVDKDGNQITVDMDTGSLYYYNLIDNFGKDSVVNVQYTSIPTGSNITDSDITTTVYRPALLWPKVILTNESGSTTNSNGSTTFRTASIFITATNGLQSFAPQILSSSLWSVGLNSRNVLTSSTQLGILYAFFYTTAYGTPASSVYGNLYQNNSTAGYGGFGGYDPAIDLIFRTNQEIRFNQNEDRVYTIISSSVDMGSRVHLFLDRAIPSDQTGSINDGFLIRENQIDPSKLVINANRLVNAPGYMTPQYISPDLVASLDKTVADLKNSGVI
jgi:hypothetical protein